MTQTTFYAWTTPAFISESPVDHTWVSTYDNRVNCYETIQAVISASTFLWYCWGSFHPQGGTPDNPTGYLGSQNGKLTIAQCLVAPNLDSMNYPAARGTIFTYGIDGVCHQLANQVLYATNSGIKPLQVTLAKGYHASSFIYGDYGLQHLAWQNKNRTCSGSEILTTNPFGVSAVNIYPDEFAIHVKTILGDDQQDLVIQLLALRDEAQAQRADVRLFQSGQQAQADALNQRNQKFIDNAAQLLGDDLFEKVFGYPPTQRINLVDPEIMRRMNGDLAA